MSEERETAQVVFTVLLTSGKQVEHRYDLPFDNEDKAFKILNPLLKRVADSLEGQNQRSLFLSHPSILYNVANVSGIQLDIIGPKELEGLVEKLKKKKRKMGFLNE
ncbi:MAG: hypothetical protein KAV98_04655 [Dehalococcoidia bacterium]|nr:hypothetical protein [Dehalococcoidia bacterium]